LNRVQAGSKRCLGEPIRPATECRAAIAFDLRSPPSQLDHRFAKHGIMAVFFFDGWFRVGEMQVHSVSRYLSMRIAVA